MPKIVHATLFHPEDSNLRFDVELRQQQFKLKNSEEPCVMWALYAVFSVQGDFSHVQERNLRVVIRAAMEFTQKIAMRSDTLADLEIKELNVEEEDLRVRIEHQEELEAPLVQKAANEDGIFLWNVSSVIRNLTEQKMAVHKRIMELHNRREAAEELNWVLTQAKQAVDHQEYLYSPSSDGEVGIFVTQHLPHTAS
jgi:hypothetical protein